jgi:hypothetical protein
MSNVNPALNSGAFVHSEALRQAVADRAVNEAVASSMRQAALNSGAAAGSTITARFEYRLSEDGSLQPVATQITAEAVPAISREESRRQGRNAARENTAERRQSFADLWRPRPRLSPSEEIAVFAGLADDASPFGVAPLRSQFTSSTALRNQPAWVEDENGELLEAEIIMPPSFAGFRSSFEQEQAQKRAVFLYTQADGLMGFEVDDLAGVAA